MSEKLPEPVRVAVEITRAALAALSPEHRHLAIDELAQDHLIIELYNEIDALKAHNDQRHEEVWAARAALGARPDETLLMAVARFAQEVACRAAATAVAGR